MFPVSQGLYRFRRQLSDLDFVSVCFLQRYGFACAILLGQVEIGQNGQITLAKMVETNLSQQRIVRELTPNPVENPGNQIFGL